MNNGQIRLTEYEGFGGTSYDSRHLSNFFNYGAPYNFGQKMARMFSASTMFNNKTLTNLTMARGNYYEISNDIYTWTLPGDDVKSLTITEFLESGNARPGYGGQTLKFALGEGWLQEPEVVLLDDNDVVLEIIGVPIQVGQNFHYEARLQDGNPASFVDPSLLAIGSTVTSISTSITTELNNKYGGDQYGSQTELQCQIGAFGRKFAVSDKVIRKELSAKNGKVSLNGRDPKYLSGYSFDLYREGKVIKQGGFITEAELRLLDRVEMDRENSMQFGKASTINDPDNSWVLKRTAPGWRQLVKDGHTFYHNGSLKPKDIEDFLMSIFLRTKDEANREIVISTGTAGKALLHNLIADEASAYLTVDTNFIRKDPTSKRSTDLSYGAQFTRYQGINGVAFSVVVDPMKDDDFYCKKKDPSNPLYTIDSYRMDIYDFGRSDASEAKGGANMAMIVEAGVESYAWACGMVDPKTGVVNSGGKVSSLDKGCTCVRELSGSLCVWDTSRIGSIIFDPQY